MNTPKPHKTGCKVCGDASSRLSRGLCSTHYAQYRRRYKELRGEARELYEADCIRDGWLLPTKKGGPPIDNDVFGAIAAKYEQSPLDLQNVTYTEDERRIIEEGMAQIDAAVARHREQKSTGKTSKQQRPDKKSG